MIPSAGTNMYNPDLEVHKKTVNSNLVSAYMAGVPNFAGFIFVFGAGSGQNIKAEEITMYFVEAAEAVKLESQLSLGATISMGSPKISFLGVGFEVEENETRMVSTAAAQTARRLAQEASGEATTESYRSQKSFDNVLTERQKRFWSWATEE